MNIKIIKTLGSGVMGTVYLAESGKTRYIYKIEKMDDVDIYNRQVDFNEMVGNQYPNSFLILKSHGVIDECDHKQPIPKWATGAFRKHLVNKNKHTKCFYLLYTPVLDCTFRDIINKVFKNNRLYLKMAYDIMSAINLMHKAGYTHNDIHGGNVMYNGKRFYLIDYGRISHKKYKSGNIEREVKRYNLSDINMILWNLLVCNRPFMYLEDHKLPIIDYKKFMKRINAFTEYKQIYRELGYLPKPMREEPAILLTAMDYPHIYCECMGLKKVIPLEIPYPNMIRYVIKHAADKNYDVILRYIKSL
jgi:serine/threonine protein kinase